MVASSLKGRDTCLVETEYSGFEKLLPVAAIFGANASGKSSLLNSMHFMQMAVSESFSQESEKPHIPRKPFKLRASSSAEPTSLALSFILDGTMIEYGFECTDEEFVGEWLYAYPNKRKQIWFERRNGVFEFGSFFKGRNSVVAELTRRDSLFLSAASATNHDQAKEIANYIKSLHFNLNYATPSTLVDHLFSEDEIDERTLKFLSYLQTGIVSYEKRSEMFPARDDENLQKLMKVINEISGSETIIPEKRNELHFLHEGAERGSLLRATNESAGSLRLILLLQQAFEAIDGGGTLFVDELDASLHTRACSALISLFLEESINKNGAQLIFTTHDTNILSSGEIRRDEVWLVEKSHIGESRLFSAAEFKLRSSDNIEKVYLDERLGGLPPKLHASWFE